MSSLVEKRAAQKRSKDSRCRFYTGYRDETCKKGVNYRAHTGGPDLGWAARLPCIPDSPLNKEPMANCEHYQPYTPEEIEQQERDIEERMKTMSLALSLIPKKGDNGTVKCPKCSGELTWSRARSNGHVWGKCKTPDCMAWMM